MRRNPQLFVRLKEFLLSYLVSACQWIEPQLQGHANWQSARGPGSLLDTTIEPLFLGHLHHPVARRQYVKNHLWRSIIPQRPLIVLLLRHSPRHGTCCHLTMRLQKNIRRHRQNPGVPQIPSPAWPAESCSALLFRRQKQPPDSAVTGLMSVAG